jgi:hypothetical protein
MELSRLSRRLEKFAMPVGIAERKIVALINFVSVQPVQGEKVAEHEKVGTIHGVHGATKDVANGVKLLSSTQTMFANFFGSHFLWIKREFIIGVIVV